MKGTYITTSGRLTVEVQGETVKALFKEVSLVQDAFDCASNCGLCNSENLRYQARQVDDYDFYELACRDCFARLSFGQAKKGGGLFPRRKDEAGNWLPNHGWSKFEKSSNGQATGFGLATAAPRPAAAPQPREPYRPIPVRNDAPLPPVASGDYGVHTIDDSDVPF